MRRSPFYTRFRDFMIWLLKPLLKIKWISQPVIRRFYFTDFITFEKAALEGRNTRNLRILFPAQKVVFASPKTDPFVPISKLYRQGWFDRPNIFVCEVPEAYFCNTTGIVCTRDLEVLVDIEPRIVEFRHNAYKKPAAIRNGTVNRLKGLHSSVNAIAAGNPYHWMVDSLPKLHSLAQYEPKAPVTLLMPDSTNPVQRESLSILLPRNFTVEYHPAQEWLQLETFLLPSLVSGFYNGHLPPEYYDSIRRPVFDHYQLPAIHSKKERIYISRQGARCRRVLNEEAVFALLKPYGFKLVQLEKLTFREQVELFHRAEIVIGPSGAGFNLITFCGAIDLVVLHPNQVPENFFHLMAQGLGQNYHYVLSNGQADDNFHVDLPALKCVLEKELHLKA
jgi:hypothetical protein